MTSVIINKQGTFRPFATPLCVYPPPFLAIHHCFYLLFKQLHVIINTSIVVVCIGMEIHVLKSVCCVIIESYLGYIQIV